MNLRESLSVFWRRWILTSVLLLITLIVCLISAFKLPASYKATVTVALLNSATSAQANGGGTNPYLSFTSSLVETANVLAIQLGSQQTTAALQSQGYTASLQATVLSENAENEEPFIQVVVSGRSAASVEQTVHGVTAEVSTLLDQLQTHLSARNRASVQTIAADDQPTRDISSKVKPLVGFLGVGLVLTFIIPQAVDGIASRRRARKPARRAAVKDPAARGRFRKRAKPAADTKKPPVRTPSPVAGAKPAVRTPFWKRGKPAAGKPAAGQGSTAAAPAQQQGAVTDAEPAETSERREVPSARVTGANQVSQD
jgi:capsular polysaccharide biosynthesis protein